MNKSSLKSIWKIFRESEKATKAFIYFVLASINVIITPMIAEIMDNKCGEIVSIISLIIYCTFGGLVLYELCRDDIEVFISKFKNIKNK